MFSQKLFRFAHKIALFAIVFASLAPSISHALQANSDVGFAQEVCSTNGNKITIQVVTSKGQQLTTEFSQQSPNNKTSQDKPPVGIQHHLQHCPFCANPSTDAAIEVTHASIVMLLAKQAEKQSAVAQVVLPRFYTLPPPAQAPPHSI